MEIKNFEKFSGLIGELLWYPKTFCRSEGAIKWETVSCRNYFSTSWMDFFCALKDGSFGKLAKELACENYIRYYRTEIETKLIPVLEELRKMEITEGKRKISVKIEMAKFRRYEEKLKRMSSEKIIFDIIQDDDDIRDTYFIDGDPAELRSYLLLTLQWVVDSFVSAEQKKIRELENRVLELDSELKEKNTLLALANEKENSLENKIEQSRKKLDLAEGKVDHLQELLSRYMENEAMEESENNDIRENSKLRMYYLYKLGLLDDGIWNEEIPQKVRTQIIGVILDAGPLKADTAIRYYKFFNSTGSSELKEYDSKNEQTFFDYMRRNCPNLKLEKGQFINQLRKL